MDDVDFTVTIRQVTTVPTVNTVGQFVNVKRVSINVGPYGPFTHDFLPGQDSPDIINAWKAKVKAEVVAIHSPA